MSTSAERRWLSPARMATLLAVLLPSLGGCLPPLDPVPDWDYTFQGTALRAGSAAPVAGAQVQVWFLGPIQEPVGPPFLDGVTDAGGGFRMRGRSRSSAAESFAAIRVTPPGGSGLTARTLSGFITDFGTRTVSGQNVTVEALVELNPNP